MDARSKIKAAPGNQQSVAAARGLGDRLLACRRGQVFRRLRHGGHQHVRVEHVHINDGGQAIIGNVKPATKHSAGDRE
jgi:hypothetical protein